MAHFHLCERTQPRAGVYRPIVDYISHPGHFLDSLAQPIRHIYSTLFFDFSRGKGSAFILKQASLFLCAPRFFVLVPAGWGICVSKCIVYYFITCCVFCGVVYEWRAIHFRDGADVCRCAHLRVAFAGCLLLRQALLVPGTMARCNIRIVAVLPIRAILFCPFSLHPSSYIKGIKPNY